MIRGIHGLFYSSDPDATRDFFKKAVKLPGSDIGEGWWIFDFPEGDLGVHPIEDPSEAGGHDISFYCDDINGTVADLKARGVKFTKDVEDHGYGLVTYFTAPGGITVQLYEPRYQKGASRKKAGPNKAEAKPEPKVAAKAAPKAAKAAAKPAEPAPKKAAPQKAAPKKAVEEAAPKKAAAKKAAPEAPQKKAAPKKATAPKVEPTKVEAKKAAPKKAKTEAPAAPKTTPKKKAK